jgi:DNA-binding Xre family transcriptional regulator
MGRKMELKEDLAVIINAEWRRRGINKKELAMLLGITGQKVMQITHGYLDLLTVEELEECIDTLEETHDGKPMQ